MNSSSSSVLSSAERSRRSSNFNIKEVKYLIELVDSRKDIIESKKSDRAAAEAKIKAWMEIEEEFNACFDDYRTFRVLKTKYDNLKKDVRRKFSSSNLSNLTVLKIMKSNENPVTNEPLSDSYLDLSEEGETLQGSNISDIDMKPSLPLNAQELDAAAEEYVFETLLFDDAQSSSQNVHQNNIPHPPQEIPAKTAQKKKNDTVDIWEEVAHKKLTKIELEMKVIEEEWTLRKQKLNLEVELLKQKLKNENSSNNNQVKEVAYDNNLSDVRLD